MKNVHYQWIDYILAWLLMHAGMSVQIHQPRPSLNYQLKAVSIGSYNPPCHLETSWRNWPCSYVCVWKSVIITREGYNDVFPLMSDALCDDFIGIRVVHHNIQGLHSKLDDLSEWFTLGAKKKTSFWFSEVCIALRTVCQNFSYLPPLIIFVQVQDLKVFCRIHVYLSIYHVNWWCKGLLSVQKYVENSCRLLNVAHAA